MKTFRHLLILLAAFWLVLSPAAFAAEPAVLLADRVYVEGDRLLIAEGNVEVMWEGSHLKASRIVYDRATDQLTIEGPITLTDGEEIAFYADQGQLSTDLSEGVLSSARLVMADQMQLSANEIRRVGGRYTQLDTVVASSCQVCPDDPVPLWSIRARQVIHDQEAKQIFFVGAQLRFGRIPVAYIPRLRFPDPTQERATGFMFPRFRTTTQLGTGIKLPYFITLGRSADVTLTPYLSSSTTTMELRFRQAFDNGNIELDGAYSRDDILPGEDRHYLFGTAMFLLPRDYRLRFGLQTVSDSTYLLDYGYSDADRLISDVELSRTRRDRRASGQIVHLRSLREDEDTSTEPSLLTETSWERRYALDGRLGGVATLSFGTLSTYRSSSTDILGRDVARGTITLDWQRSEVFGPGMMATALVRATGESHAISQDSTYPASVTRAIPETAVTLRWPLARTGSRGASQILEPMAMLAWSPEDLTPVPNEDSTVSEFDEGNLLALSRFPGLDARETGLRFVLGMGWTRHDAAGRTLRLGFGRILRDQDYGTFGAGTGLDGQDSNWLATFSLGLPERLNLSARTLFDDQFELPKGELRLDYTGDIYSVGTSLLFMSATPTENRLEDIAEWSFNGTWQVTPQWSTRTNWHYDFQNGNPTRAGLGVTYQNECILVDLSANRRFTSTTTLEPTTDIRLSVELAGFGTGGRGGVARRTCLN